MKKILLLLIAFICTANAFAVDFYWKSTGRADQIYTNAANWESAPGSGTPANGSLAPSSIDDVYFPVGNLTQTITISSGAAARNFNVLSTGIITLGTVNVYGNFTSNGKHLFSSGMTFLGTGSHTIDMGDNLPHTSGTTGGDFLFSGTGTYTLLSDLNLPLKSIGISNSTFIANGFWVQVGSFSIGNTVTGTKTVNLANSKLSVNRGAANSGAIVIAARPTTTSYDWTNAEIYINQSTNSTFIQLGGDADGTSITGIKSITFTETTPGVTAEQIRSNAPNFTLGVTDFDINVSAFNFTSGSLINLNITNLNLLKPVDITSTALLKLNLGTINEAVSCIGQSSIRSEGGTPISFNATVPISTSNIGFKSITFLGSTVTIPVNNDLGLNTGTYATSTASTSRSFYWVGGTGNWNDPTKWSVIGSGGATQASTGCIPNYNDDVYFDANSFTSSAQIVTIGSSASTTNMAYARNVYWTDSSRRGRLTGGGLNINGSADFSGSTGVASALVYVGSGNHTVKSGSTAYTSGSIQFFGTGIYTLTDDLTVTSALLQISAGTFNSNGKNITARRFVSSSIPYSTDNIRHINISNSILIFSESSVGSGSSAFALNTPFLGSFNATGSTINCTATQPQFYVNGHNADVLLSTITFNDINFTSNTNSALFVNSGVLNFVANNIRFNSNATIQQILGAAPTHRVNTYNFSPGKVYSFYTSSNASTAPVYTVVNSINTNSIGSCSPKVTIQSSSAGYRAKIYKASLPFEVSNAIMKDINATGAIITVPGGEDLGNNLNVNITSNPSQDFYWVGGTGNWNDASHWSIAVSGGNPATTNTNNCVPSLNDNVFFDGNSFTGNNQTITIDIDASCRNMTWDSAVSSRTPIFAGITGLNLNTYGFVRLAPNMTFPFAGNWNMRGNSLIANSNAITTNGVVVRSILTLNGGGRYDFLDNFISTSNIRFSSGQFYTNSNNITSASLNLQVTGNNKADISNSVITLNGVDNTTTYAGNHSTNLANWNATGSTININVRGISINTPTGVTIEYGTMNVNQSILATLNGGSGTVKFTNLNFLRATSSMSGRFIVDHLRYTNSSDNSIGSGSTITVNNFLTANGTPCNPIRFRATTPGTPATFISTLCNFDIKFARLTDIRAGGTCTIAQNKVVGDDAGGNSNWTFSTVAGFEYLGADKVLKCNEYPYTLSTASFNQDATSILWSNGATTPDITVTGPGTYSVTVTYGAGCNLTDAITLGLTPNPVLNAATIYACETTAGAAIGDFNLTDANAILVSTPADYTFSYHATSTDAIANSNPLTSPYNSASGTIYVRVVETATGCYSTRNIVLTVRAKVSPTVAPNQKICATVHTSLANLTITGTDIKWYADLVTPTVLPSTTLLMSGTTYYATQTVAGGCESDRVPVTVVLENCSRSNPSLRMRAKK
ncbi:beta strand repeat-containing protein [Flavobacterium sp. PLA-1-15]|uniref:beta strand repeat-containing protein n=1 Tax=Flavobacterium sp. PLA-1-15 TaxID=3380533 RepID=UPI003B81D62A